MRTIVNNMVADLSYVISSTAELHGIEKVFFSGSLITQPLIRAEFTNALGNRKVMRPKVSYVINYRNNNIEVDTPL